MRIHRAVRIFTFLATAFLAGAVFAREYSAGDVRIRDPFATPTPPGAKVGATYFARLENRGKQPDRLLRASSPIATTVELHSGEIGADGVMRMRERNDIAIAPGTVMQLGPGKGEHLMLIGLKKPLAAGDTFAMTLEFERGGKVEVKVTVQDPKASGNQASGNRASESRHKH